MSFKLIIEDDRVAAWSAINNTFTMVPLPDPRRQYDQVRHGMLIQVGRFVRWPTTDELMELFSGIKCKPAKARVMLGKAEIVDPALSWWINIKQGPDAMTITDLGDLRILPTSEQPALRKFFTPYPGGITIWPSKGLTIGMKIKKLRNMSQQNFSCTFSLTGAVTVELWKNGVLEQDQNNVTEIRITSEDRKPGPGQNYNPPQYP